MTFEDITEGKPASLIELLYKLRNLIQSLSEYLTEEILEGKVARMASYFIGDRNNVVCVITIGKDHCQLFLHHTDSINSGNLKLQGKGKHAKHIKIFTEQDLNDTKFKDVIKQIIEIARTKAHAS